MQLIEVENLSKIYGHRKKPAVDNISFRISDGEILGFAGLNGAGKTTTINMISGALLPSRGHVFIDGLDIVKDKARASRSVGWVSEFPSFEMNVKPLHLIQYFAGFYNISTPESRRIGMELLSEVGLKADVNRKLRDYSQGMKKRFGLVTAMISSPKNYLLDEILNGLDPEGVEYVRKRFLEFKKMGKSILLSTHILGVLENIADRIAIIHKGKIIRVISRDEIKSLGKPVLELKTHRTDDNLLKLLRKYGNPRVKDDRIVISDIGDPESSALEVSAAVVGNNYGLLYLGIVGESLEEYFLQLIGGSE